MIVDWINLWAFAVAEENAAGGKIITAPTMGSAGVLPAVMRYYQRFAIQKSPYSREQADIVFLTYFPLQGDISRLLECEISMKRTAAHLSFHI